MAEENTSALDDDGVRPEVRAAIDRLAQSSDLNVRSVMELADQRGYSDHDTYVMLADHLASRNRDLGRRVIAMELEAPVRYVLVTQDRLDQLIRDGAAKP
jgi:hypothetical protein